MNDDYGARWLRKFLTEELAVQSAGAQSLGR